MAELEKKISRQVGWLNHNVGLAIPISCSDVLPVLVQVGQAQAMKILKDVEQSAPQIENPTSYVLMAASNAGAEPVAAIAAPAFHPVSAVVRAPAPVARLAAPTDPTGKIARQVGWLNQHAGLKEKISFSDVVGPLSEIDVTSAMKILKDLEEGAPRIERPTAYVAAAASRLAPFSAPRAGGVKRSLTVGVPQTAVVQAAAGAAPAVTVGTAPNASPEDDEGRKIARQVGWLNQHAGLAERISYSDVKESLEACDLRTAMKILKDVESTTQSIRNPTSFIIAAAQRAQRRGAVRGGVADEARAIAECWDFQQGHCPRGDKCRYAHQGLLASPPAQSISDNAQLSISLGLNLGEQALLDLSSIPTNEAESLLQEMASAEKVVADPDAYVAKVCSRVRAEAFRGNFQDGGLVVKRLRMAM